VKIPARFVRRWTVVGLVAGFIAHEPLTAKAANHPAAGELQLIQGTWEGGLVGDLSLQKTTITISGNSLRFHRDKKFWFDTTIALPAGTHPKQLRATIKGCPMPDSIGKVIGAIFKIEGDALTLATTGDEEAPKSFDARDQGLMRYEFRRVQPARDYSRPPRT
jgi:uncharacterized protein (TIGR03067 family)